MSGNEAYRQWLYRQSAASVERRRIGLLRRNPFEDGNEATERAMRCQWWEDGAELDSRATGWWSWWVPRSVTDGESE